MSQFTIEGKSYNVNDIPELKSIIEQDVRSATKSKEEEIRKEAHRIEKDKLYTQIEDLKREMSKLKDVKVEETPRTEKQPTFDTDAFTKSITEALTEKFSGLIDTKLETLTRPLAQQVDYLKGANLNDYRAKLLQENQGKCMPELVVGNTKEEIDSALEQSKKLYASYVVASASDTPKEKPAPKSEHTTSKETPNTEATSTEELSNKETKNTHIPEPPKVPQPSATSEDIASMSQEEYAEKRSALKAKVQAIIS